MEITFKNAGGLSVASRDIIEVYEFSTEIHKIKAQLQDPTTSIKDLVDVYNRVQSENFCPDVNTPKIIKCRQMAKDAIKDAYSKMLLTYKDGSILYYPSDHSRLVTTIDFVNDRNTKTHRLYSNRDGSNNDMLLFAFLNNEDDLIYYKFAVPPGALDRLQFLLDQFS